VKYRDELFHDRKQTVTEVQQQKEIQRTVPCRPVDTFDNVGSVVDTGLDWVDAHNHRLRLQVCQSTQSTTTTTTTHVSCGPCSSFYCLGHFKNVYDDDDDEWPCFHDNLGKPVQDSKTSLNLNEARDDGDFGMQWHQLDHMQTICTSPQTDNHINTSSLNFTGWMLFVTPNQQCQSTEGKAINQ